MIGLIQKVLLDMVQQLGGDEALAEVKRRTGLAADFQYRLDTDYDNEEVGELLKNACLVLGVDQEAAFRAYAQFFLAETLTRFPTFFRLSADAREFLARQPAIHNMLASGLRDTAKRDAVNDKFAVEDGPEGKLLVYYRSPNRFCGLYFALAEEVAKHYGQQVQIDVLQCRKRGDAECAFQLQFNAKDGSQ
ncbi:heme NO-binding domain-containing protein [Acidithiobacillus sp. AC3]